ncbi:MAG: TIGR02757 family protein [Paludibacter sp.]|jgi:uncharacterized protein (TIGR02757 family)|nr:TIGR02757 family protein [Paludibacter sp.]
MKDFLDEQVQLINNKAFITDDPVQFPRRYERVQDIEIVAFTVSTIAWGKRSMILRSAERMLARMGESPYEYVMNETYENLEKANVHRTFFEPDLAFMLRGFKNIYANNESIDTFLQKNNVSNPWQIAAILRNELVSANKSDSSRFLSANAEKSALKRLNLALRWLVRNDGIVDLGVWKCLTPAQLYIPLDVHVGNVARRLGLLQRTQNDRHAVEELTAVLRSFCPADPVKYDYALFGIGVMEKAK